MFYVADQQGHPDSPKHGHVYVSLGSLTTPLHDVPKAHVSYEERVGWNEDRHCLPRYLGKTDERIS
jgi:hypothetical protein